MFRTGLPLIVALLVSASPPVAAAVERKDYQILRDVSAAVNASPHFTIFDDVAAGVAEGIVTLTGKVTMEYKRDELGKRVEAVAGVRDVRNQIDILPASTGDNELRQQISRAIYGNSSFWNYAVMPNPPIHIIVEHSRVTLTGVVRSEVDRRLAQALANQFAAMSVTNNLKTDAEMQAGRETS
jgi:osmotically-inducible protein OsmY